MEGDTGNGAAGGEEGAGGAASGPAPNDAVKQRRASLRRAHLLRLSDL